MYKFYIALFSLIAPATFLFSQEDPLSPTTLETEVEWSLLKGEDWEVNHPADWTVDQSGTMGSTFLLFSPLTNAEDDFSENINFVTEDISAHDINLEQYTELSLNMVRKLLVECEILSSELIQSDKANYQKVMYKGVMGIYKLKFVQYYMIYEKDAVVLTFTSEEDQFDIYLEKAEKILNGFVFNPK